MSRTSKTLLRLGVPSLAAATMIGGIPAFIGSAQAAAVTSLSITPIDGPSSAAGACQAFVITGTGINATSSTVGEKINVVVTDATGNASSNVDFCTLPSSVNDTDTVQGNETTFTPAAGTVISAGGAQTGGGSVDQSSFTLGANQTGVNSSGTAAGAANSGQVVVGITRNIAGGPVSIQAYQDLNGNNTFDAAANEVQVNTTTTFTAGGTNGSNENQNAVTVVDARQSVEDTSDVDQGFAGETRTFLVFLSNGTDPVEGATVNYVVTNAASGAVVSGPAVFGNSDNDGRANGSITLPTTVGNYNITFYVNRSDGANTPGLDQGERSNTITEAVQAAQAAATVDVIPLADSDTTTVGTAAYQQSPAINPRTDGTREFLVRTDNTGTATGTAVTVTVTGGDGDEFVTFAPGSGESGRQADGVVSTLDATTTGSTTDRSVRVIVTDPDANSAAGIPAGQVLTVTATVRGQAAADSETLTFVATPADARNIDLTPKVAFTPTGAARAFTARVIDANGQPVVGVPVTFSESGPGAFRNGESQLAPITTNRNGEATAEVIAASGEQGQQTITATITNTGNQTTQAAGAGTPAGSRAGNFTDTAVNNVAIASPTPSASASASATPTATATASPSGSASPTATGSASPSSNPVQRLGISVSPATITPGIQSVVRVTGAPGSIVELQAYSRPSTTYAVVRRGTIGESGAIEFRVTPGTNTRLFAAVTGVANTESPSVVINVRTALSLTVIRNGARNYTFQGRILPRRSGQLITLYRVNNNGSEVLTAQVRTDNTGTWRINRRFTGSGTFNFVARTGQTLTNASGASNVRRTAIF